MEEKQIDTKQEGAIADAENQPSATDQTSIVSRFCSTIARWTKRLFFGGSNLLAREAKNDDIFSIEKIESPGKQRLKAFFSKKLAVGALIIFLAMFVTMLVGPAFFPLDLAYTEDSQKNVSPGLNMMSVPREMRDDVKSISSNSKFTVGLSNKGKVYVWGDTKLLSCDLSDIPEEVLNNKIVHVAAGTDHIIAIDENGKVYGWGQNSNGQYGAIPDNDNGTLAFMYTYAPKEVLEGTLDVANIKQLVCGTQVTAIVMNDGSLYMWGNHSLGATNLSQIKALKNVEKIIFTKEIAVAILKDGTYSAGNSPQATYTYIMVDGKRTRVKLQDYLTEQGLKVVDVGTAGSSIAFITDDGRILLSGTYSSGEDAVPTLADGESFVSVSGGLKHYTAVTNKGTVYSWGSNVWKQTNVPSKLSSVAQIFTGPFQNYAINENDELIDTWGLRGYPMGTDGFGRDIWTRIVNGGRMTMSIGAIAVIISSIIGIIVGCLSGYFGGWVDMLLMRLAEIISAIPFLPFALILSLVVTSLGLEEMTRIVLIMFVLGVLSWPGLARLVRGQVLAEREKEFVIAAKAMGVKEWKIAFKHILPNVISIIIVTMTLDFAGCMLTESSLSYLGFGVKAPRPTWGNMLDGANNSIIIQNYWWQWLFPSIFLMITTICINIIGDALRDVMDPKSNSGR